MNGKIAGNRLRDAAFFPQRLSCTFADISIYLERILIGRISANQNSGIPPTIVYVAKGLQVALLLMSDNWIVAYVMSTDLGSLVCLLELGPSFLGCEYAMGYVWNFF